jgi:hypothetical protein
MTFKPQIEKKMPCSQARFSVENASSKPEITRVEKGN